MVYARTRFEETFLFNIADQESFQEFANAGKKAILDGKTSEEARKISIETSRKWFQHYTQREIKITNKILKSIEELYLLLPKTSKQNLSLIKEAFRLRIHVLENEIEFFFNKKKWKVESEKTLKAFKQIEEAEELVKRIKTDNKTKEKLMNLLRVIKKRWVHYCSKCGTINPIQVINCNVCQDFLPTQKSH